MQPRPQLPERSAKAPRPLSSLFPDLFTGLMWPILLKSGGLAARPARLGLALLLVVLVSLSLQLPQIWSQEAPITDLISAQFTNISRSFADDVRGTTWVKTQVAWKRLLEAPLAIKAKISWLSLAAALLPAIAAWALIGGAISRNAAVDFAIGEREPWTRSLGQSLSKWPSMLGVFLGPITLLAGVLLLLAVAGWMTLGLPWIQVVGAVLAVAGMLIGILATIFLLAIVLGFPMLGASVACEGTDAVDGMQRVVAYVLGRPVRYLAYLLLFLFLLIIYQRVLSFFVERGIIVAATAMTAFLPENSMKFLKYWILQGEAPQFLPDASTSLQTTGKVAGFGAGFLRLLVPAYAISFFHTGGALLYLATRWANDGQEPTELWRPRLQAQVLAQAEADADAATGEREINSPNTPRDAQSSEGQL